MAIVTLKLRHWDSSVWRRSKFRRSWAIAPMGGCQCFFTGLPSAITTGIYNFIVNYSELWFVGSYGELYSSNASSLVICYNYVTIIYYTYMELYLYRFPFAKFVVFRHHLPTSRPSQIIEVLGFTSREGHLPEGPMVDSPYISVKHWVRYSNSWWYSPLYLQIYSIPYIYVCICMYIPMIIPHYSHISPCDPIVFPTWSPH